MVFDSPGLINPDGSISPFPFQEVKGFIIQRLAAAEIGAWIGRDGVNAVLDVVNAVLDVVNRESRRLDKIDAETCLVHGDFNPTNVLIVQTC